MGQRSRVGRSMVATILAGLVATGAAAGQASAAGGDSSVDRAAAIVEAGGLADLRVWIIGDCVVAVRRSAVRAGAYGGHGVDYAPGPVLGIEPC